MHGEMTSIPMWIVESAAFIIAGTIEAAFSNGRWGALLLIAGVVIALRATRPED
jgi:hypothetical protein